MPYGNIYYNPEDYDCEIVDELDYGLSYEFDKVVVFRRKTTDELAWGSDSGCSCPTPFDRFNGFEDLDKLPETLADFELAVRRLGYREEVSADKLEFIQKVKKLLKA